VKDKDHTVTESISNTWGLGGRAGMLINDNTLLFGAAGVAGATLHVAMTPGGDEDPIDESGSLTGYYIGAGLETLLKNGWSLKGEYRYSGYSGGFDTADYKNKDGEEKWLNIGNLVTQSVRLTLDRRF
jgi:opacity protein-like surface antigen